MSHLRDYYDHLLGRGLSEDDAVVRLAVVQNVDPYKRDQAGRFATTSGANRRQQAAEGRRKRTAERRTKNRERLKKLTEDSKLRKEISAKAGKIRPKELDAAGMKALRNELEEAAALLRQAEDDPKQADELRKEALRTVVKVQRSMRMGGMRQSRIQEVLRDLIGPRGLAKLARR